MMELEEINHTIFQLSKERCLNPSFFEEFTAGLFKIGVIRQTYDVMRDEVSFYSKDKILSTFAMTDIDPSAGTTPFLFGDRLDVNVVKQAITEFDSGVIASPTEFHKKIALAGVIYVSVHLAQRTIYYLSQDAQFYLESY